MKKCPQCGTTYTDATLKFCLADGGLLEEIIPESVPPTRREGLKINIPEPATIASARKEEPKRGLSTMAKVLIALGVFAVLGVVLVVAAAIVLFVASDIFSARQPVPASTPEPTTPTPASTPSPKDETEELAKRLEELAKKIEEEVGSGNTPKAPALKDVLGDDSVATVNSPNDGFLALRSLPSTDIGERIDRIPHGSEVFVVSCNDQRETLSGRRGRWCLVEWNSKVGWVFDAWLNYR